MDTEKRRNAEVSPATLELKRGKLFIVEIRPGLQIPRVVARRELHRSLAA